MLKKLILNQYGKFGAGTEFAFGPVTVFSGENEAGKTTLFDALGEALCEGNIDRSTMLRLNSRYGKERRAALEQDGAALAFDSVVYQNIFAVRSSSLALENPDVSDWAERIKSALFSEGINPLRIRADLEDRASTDGKKSHNKALKKLRGEAEELKKRLSELEAERAAILSGRRQTRELAGEIAGKERVLATLEKQRAEMAAIISREELIMKRRSLDDVLEFLHNGETLLAQAQELAPYRENELPYYDTLRKKSDELNQRIAQLRLQAENCRERAEKLAAGLRELEAAIPAMKMAAECAERIKDRIAAFQNTEAFVQKTVWKKELITAGILALCAGSTAAFFLGGLPARAAAAACGVAACLALVLTAKRTRMVRDEQAEKRCIDEICDNWKNSVRDGADIRRETLEGMRELMMMKAVEYGDAQANAARMSQEAADMRGRMEQVRLDLMQAESEASAHESGMRQWLADHGAASRDAYQEKALRSRQIAAALADWNKKLDALLKQHECKDTAHLKRECERALNELDAQGIPKSGMPATELALLKKRHEDVLNQSRALNDAVTGLKLTLKGTQGYLEGRNIAGQICAIEREIAKTAAEIEQNELEREAAAEAARIFGEIAADAGRVFEDLAREFARAYGEILPQARAMEIRGLGKADMKVADAGGEKRSLDLLSSGTRDSFLFAARLCLARRSSEGTSVLVLDEPFLTFDEDRQRKAVAMLKKFHDDTGWQIVVLTKDERLVDALKSSFPPRLLVHHRLSYMRCAM